MDSAQQKLTALRELLVKHQLHGLVIPSNDEYQGEYIPDSARRLEFMTGFTGSAGTAVILRDRAAFFTDGRYVLQAEQQVPTDYEKHNIATLTPARWAAQHLPKDAALGLSAWLHSENDLTKYTQAGLSVTQLDDNPVDAIWHNRPAPPASAVTAHDLAYAGESAAAKLARLTRELQQKNLDHLLLTAPDSICWLLNIRANDVPYTPFALCYALISKEGDVLITLDASRLAHAQLPANCTPATLAAFCDAVLHSKRIQLDPANTPLWFVGRLKNANVEITRAADPCQLWKACKNPVEIAGMKAAHQRDGKALTAFLAWLEEALPYQEITEITVAEKLLEFRKRDPLFREPSFATIAGFGANGAIVHYHATPESNTTLRAPGLLLLDSGGQYPDGTTDVTRTLAIGTPTPAQKTAFTRVLKGHIALATAIFPEGTTGSQLDVLARQYLWQAGQDYDHGTGHGVGSYLSVHEGPQRISKVANTIPLQPGMILSNEPGYYEAGEYGIRIENLVLVVEKPEFSKPGKRFFGFETLTRVPIDTRLVEYGALTDSECAWLKEYNG